MCAGKVRYLDNSNFSGWQIADADWIPRTRGSARYVSAQNQYNLLDRRIEREVLPACEKFGLGILPYNPLAGGFLTGKYRRAADIPADTRMALMRGMAKHAKFSKVKKRSSTHPWVRILTRLTIDGETPSKTA